MTIANVLLLIFILLLALFVGLNWQPLGAMQPLDFGFSTGEGPLGLILLAAIVMLLALHVIGDWFRDASGAVNRWQTERQLNEARERAMASDDNRIERLASDFEAHRDEVQTQMREVLKRLENVSIKELLKDETDDVEERIAEAEKEIRQDISKNS